MGLLGGMSTGHKLLAGQGTFPVEHQEPPAARLDGERRGHTLGASRNQRQHIPNWQTPLSDVAENS